MGKIINLFYIFSHKINETIKILNNFFSQHPRLFFSDLTGIVSWWWRKYDLHSRIGRLKGEVTLPPRDCTMINELFGARRALKSKDYTQAIVNKRQILFRNKTLCLTSNRTMFHNQTMALVIVILITIFPECQFNFYYLNFHIEVLVSY